MQSNPIGVFDSGVGGTSIWKEIHKLLPLENTIYLADSANAPYGEKSTEEIIQLSVKNTELLLSYNCKLIVVACNTATTNAIKYLRNTYADVSFIGIEPAIKPAVLQSNSKTVGVLATKGTLSSSLFHSTVKSHAEGIKIIEKEGKGLVPLIEAGKASSKETKTLLKTFLAPMLAHNIDYLVLGCTHYPYLVPVLKELLPKHVNIIDSGEAVARQTKAVLTKNSLLNTLNNKSSHRFYTNADVPILKSFLTEVKSTINVVYLDF
ncbi:glutamate racemase [Cellulophaga omnivescoria]|uniref:glutamate racemase n=1 Tax=Cellulophaga omnivescoria TaxID=1888890 RepID=UPI00098462DA|nr:glutamate racemase [Cellulophaga omnivescoria]WBU88140.1 glutamate racemase [Cellulophaga omnivescoria]WKB80120.1 glutamate racemase [Cellulophaga lytica]